MNPEGTLDRERTALRSLPLLSRKDSAARRERILKQVTEQAQSGRRLAIYEQATGFLAPWYMRLRVTEECARSTRYARPLSVMVLQVEGTGSTLREWLLRGLRSTDLVCRTVEGDYYVLLTETDASGASEVMKRLLAEVPVHRVWSASFLTETERFKSLLDPLDATLPTV